MAVPPASTAAVRGRLGTAAVPVRGRVLRGSLGNPVAGIPVVGSPAGEADLEADIPEQKGQCTEGAARNSSLPKAITLELSCNPMR